MASTYWPDGSPKSVDDIEYEVLGTAFAPDGIIGYPGDSSVVFGDSSGRQVKVRSGKYGQVKGRGWASGASDIIKSIAANGTGQPRIDLVVLGLNRSTWAVTEYVLTGTAAASPVAPALTRAAMGPGTGIWEIPLATVAVAAGASTISAANVTPIHAWIGQTNQLTFANTTGLNAWPAADGMRAEVDGTEYVRVSGAWRRADWNSAWGVVGGRNFNYDTGSFITGVTSETVVPTFSSGNVSVISGRRYHLQALTTFYRPSTTGGVEMRIRDTNVSGTTRGSRHIYCVGGQGYSLAVHGSFDATSDTTKTFVLTATSHAAGAVDVLKNNEMRLYLAVTDVGPAANMPTI